MAKWSAEEAGSSFRRHSSLWDTAGRAAFWDGSQPLGMSETFRLYLAGQLTYTPELMYFYAPFVNSYKRYREGTFAPIRLAWGHDNRTCGLRVIGEHNSLRVENRVPGADANPYLAFAATIAAGIAGLEQRLELPEVFTGHAYEAETGHRVPRVPGALYEAIQLFEHIRLARTATSLRQRTCGGRWRRACGPSAASTCSTTTPASCRARIPPSRRRATRPCSASSMST